MILYQKATVNQPKCPNTINFVYYLHLAAKLLIEPILSPHRRHYLLSPFTHTRSHITLRLTSLPTRSHHLLPYILTLCTKARKRKFPSMAPDACSPPPLGSTLCFLFGFVCVFPILCCVSFLHTLCHSASDATCQI